MEAIQSAGGCPQILRLDAGTENVNIAKMQRFLHDDEDNGNSVIIGASHHNVKIESWWAQYRKHNSEFFLSMFHGLANEGLFTGDVIEQELVCFCFLNIILVIL